MRQGQGSKRSRGRGGGRRNAPQRHQNFDSNGPSIRIRGNANQVYEKYLQLARDANTAGDRVTAENMFQHAEHYFRVLNVEERESQQARPQNWGNGEDGQGVQPPNRGNGAENRHSQRQPHHEARPRGENSNDGDLAPDAKGQPAMREHDGAESVGGDAHGEENKAPRRPQRRSRQGSGRATQSKHDDADAGIAERPESAEKATQTSASEGKRENPDAPTDKQAAD